MSGAFARYDAFPHAPLHAWKPAFPPGRIDRIYLHWSSGDYETVYPAYHFCIASVDGMPVVVETRDLRANMRDVRDGGDYAAHTAGRNGFSAGVSIMAMRGARPENFGAFPLLEPAVDALCAVVAAVARRYALHIDADHVLTHAEAALLDGYFGCANDEQRWDIARLGASLDPLTPEEARATGDELRARARAR